MISALGAKESEPCPHLVQPEITEKVTGGCEFANCFDNALSVPPETKGHGQNVEKG